MIRTQCPTSLDTGLRDERRRRHLPLPTTGRYMLALITGDQRCKPISQSPKNARPRSSRFQSAPSTRFLPTVFCRARFTLVGAPIGIQACSMLGWIVNFTSPAVPRLRLIASLHLGREGGRESQIRCREVLQGANRHRRLGQTSLRSRRPFGSPDPNAHAQRVPGSRAHRPVAPGIPQAAHGLRNVLGGRQSAEIRTGRRPSFELARPSGRSALWGAKPPSPAPAGKVRFSSHAHCRRSRHRHGW
jgi:hypothetical protein